ncbi:MAG: hypothetical protein GX957_08610, partial [Clostridiaceae bacterium]|nr:hypothetical protein [Clostridiaceae bacterium]
EDAKIKLDALEYSNEALTENDIKELLFFSYEDVKFFDNKRTNYDVSELWIRKGNLNIIMVRYRNNEADEFDAIDISVSAEQFEIQDFKDKKT